MVIELSHNDVRQAIVDHVKATTGVDVDACTIVFSNLPEYESNWCVRIAYCEPRKA